MISSRSFFESSLQGVCAQILVLWDRHPQGLEQAELLGAGLQKTLDVSPLDLSCAPDAATPITSTANLSSMTPPPVGQRGFSYHESVNTFKGNRVLKENKWLWKFRWSGEGLDCPRCRLKMAFAEDNRKVIVSGMSYVSIYDSATGLLLDKRKEPLWDYPARWHTVKGAALTPGGHLLAAWYGPTEEGHDLLGRYFKSNNVTIWNVDKNELVGRIDKTRELCSAVFSAHQREIFTGSMGGHVSVWSVSGREMIKEWSAHSINSQNWGIDHMTVSSDGRFLATCGFVGGAGYGIRVWDASTNQLQKEFVYLDGGFPICGVYSMAFGREGSLFAFESKGRLCLYETKTWQERWCVLSWPEAPQ
jgi:WD40 repeat protein